jgi:hypothetical protein
MRAIRECDVWICDYPECLGFWLAQSDKVPEKCPKCKRRGWHQQLSTAELIRKALPVAAEKITGLTEADVEAIARRVFHEEWSAVPVEMDEPEELLAVSGNLADKLAVARAALASVGGSSVPAIVPNEPCPWRDPPDEAGDIYGCALRIGHKGRHVKGPKVGDIW